MRDSQLAHRLKPYLFGAHGPAAFKDVYRGVDVTDHGADPTGVADSQAAIQAALDSLKPGGGSVFFPPGTYRLGIGLLIPLIEYTGGPIYLTGYGATLDYTGSGRAIELGTNCSGLLGADAYQYAERSAHIEGLTIKGTASAAAGVYFNGATHCSLRNAFLSGFSSVAAGAAAIVLYGDYYHWTEQCQIDTVDIDDAYVGVLFDFNPGGSPPGGSTMNNTLQNLHIWVRTAGGAGIRARHPLQWMGRNTFSNIVVHPVDDPPAAPADNVTCFDLGTAYLRGTVFIACSGDVYGNPTGTELFSYDGDDPLTILGTQTDPPTYAGWTDATMFAGTSEQYNVLGHRNRFKVGPKGWVTITNEATSPVESVGLELFAGGAGAIATLGAYGAGDGTIYSKIRLGNEEGAHLWEFDHRQDFADRFALNFYNGSSWANAFAIYPTTLDFIAGGHLVTKVYAGAPSGTPDNGALAVDDVAHALYFRSGGAWYSAAGGGGGLPPGGTTAQFLRGDGAWSGTLTGPLTVAGLTVGTLSGALKAASGVVSGGATTSDVPEGSNLYYTDTRVANYLTNLVGTDNSTTFLRGDGTWANTLTGGLNVGSASGAAAGQIKASDYAGLGGHPPTYPLTAGLKTAATWGQVASFRSGSGDLEAIIRCDGDGYVRLGSGTNHGLILRTNNTDRVTVDTAGTVSVTGGLNVGSAAGAAAGEGRFSGGVYPGGPAGFATQFYLKSRQYTNIPGNSTVNIGTDLGLSGVAFLRFAAGGSIAIFLLPATNPTVEVSDPAGHFIATAPADSSNQIGVYASGGTYLIKNAYASAQTVLVHFLAV